MNAEADVMRAAGELACVAAELACLPGELDGVPGEVGLGLFGQSKVGWLQPLREDWPTAVCRRLECESAVVRVLVAEVRGSGPREVGACMLVTHEGIEGTIGGGNLEWHAVEAARSLLRARPGDPSARVQRYTLGPELAQCCGGVVHVWMERLTRADLPLLRRIAGAANSVAPMTLITKMTAGAVARSLRDVVGSTARAVACSPAAAESSPASGAILSSSRSDASSVRRVLLTTMPSGNVTLLERIDRAHTPVWLYGAGHTGQAVVRMLADLPFDISWADSRAELFPQGLPANVRALLDPRDAVSRAPQSARHIVMTHDHALDYDLCHAILTRNEFAWLGLIGSESKAARFRSRLKRDGVAPGHIARLVCPIGLTDIESKLPAAIAIGIAAQLLRQTTAARVAHDCERADDAVSIGNCSAESCASCRQTHR